MPPRLEQLEELGPVLHAVHAELLADYPEHIRRTLLEAKTTAEWIRFGIAERSTLTGLAAELKAGPDLPDVPLIALSALGADPSQPAETLRAVHEARRRMDAAVARAVSHGEQRILTDTFHHRLCFDRPDAVVRAIRDVLDRVARP